MGPIPKDLNLDRLVGRQLEQICIGACDVQFRFGGEDKIRGSGFVSVEHRGRIVGVFTEEGWEDSRPLCEIVGMNVVGWKKESSHVLSIVLEDSYVLRLRSEDSRYEDWILDPEVFVW